MSNLKSIGEYSTDKQRLIQRKGGIASGIAKRRKKTFAELAKAMMDCKPNKKELQAIKQVFPELDLEEVTNRSLMIRKQMDKAVKDGDTKAFEVLRDTIGEKPTEKLAMTDKDGENLNVKYELMPATKEALKKQKKERKIIDE